MSESRTVASQVIAMEACDIKKSYGSTPILKGVSFQLPERSVLGIIGGSGSGKSTLLRCLNLLIAPDSGYVTWYGKRLGWVERNGQWLALSERENLPIRREIGMVFQGYNLFPHKTALENIMEGPIAALNRPKNEVRDEALSLLEKVKLTKRAGAFPHEMSGGEQQRVAIARALAMRPQALLFDEVTSALDPELKGEVLNVMKELAEGGMTMVVVTHEMGFMRRVAHDVIFMHQGLVHEKGRADELFAHPRTTELRSLLSQVEH